MMKSLYSGVAGMKVHNQRMDVIGNNVSNVNTTGYKASNVTFKDIYYQTKQHASSGSASAGGRNPTQIGYGAQLGTVTQVMTQSGFTYTDNEYDCALEGDGFFQVMDASGNIFYTRAGVFSVDSYGNLCDPSGNVVLGVSGDPSGMETGQSQRIVLNVPEVDNNKASCTKNVNGYGLTVTASGYGDEGNIAFTVVNSANQFATRSGSNLTIYMDLDTNYGEDAYEALLYEDVETLTPRETEPTDDEKRRAFETALQEFEDALNDAILQGGVGLEDNVIPLDLDFDSMPPYDEVQARSATNTIFFNVPAQEADENDPDSEAREAMTLALDFTANKPGAFGNSYEIDFRTSSSQGSTTVSAKWSGKVLTITLPENYNPEGDTTDYGEGASEFTLVNAINKAISDASGGDPKKLITCSLASVATQEQTGDEEEQINYVTENTQFGFDLAIGTGVDRLGLDNGKDNFFSEVAQALSTVMLTDGRYAAPQQIDDLETIQIDQDGVIYGRHAVHGVIMLGRIDVVTFENPMGLDQVGTSMWRSSQASGEPQVKIPGSEGAGKIISGAREMSNVDLAQEFSDMIITQRGYQANSRIITVSDTMLEELVNLKR